MIPCRLAAAVTLGLSLGACAVTPDQCDPAKNNLLQSAVCQASGTSDKRIAEQEQAYSELKQQVGGKSAAYKKLSAEQRLMVTKVELASSKLAKLQSETLKVSASTEAQKNQLSDLSQRIELAQQEAALLERQILEKTQKEQTINQKVKLLREEQFELEDLLEAMLEGV